MKFRILFAFCLSFLPSLLAVGTHSSAHAQAYKYIDRSGNVHFVASVMQVPEEYRYQVIKPTPTPFLSQKETEKLARDIQSGRYQKRIEAERKKAEKEKEKQKREKEREQKKLERERQKEEAARKKREKAEGASGGQNSRTSNNNNNNNAPSSNVSEVRNDVQVEIYAISTCPDCNTLEKLLKDHNIRYMKYNIEKSDKANKFYQKVGGGDLPMIRYGNKVLKGFNPRALSKMIGFELSGSKPVKGKEGRPN